MEINLIQPAIYLFVGFVEMFLATARTTLIARGKILAATSIVFVENLTYFIILYQIINSIDRNWPIFVAYSMGGSLGTFVNLKKFS